MRRFFNLFTFATVVIITVQVVLSPVAHALSSTEQGETTLGSSSASDDPPDPSVSPYWWHEIRRWDYVIGLVSDEYGVDPDLLAAIIQAESEGKSGAVSSAGAVGLMGIMPYDPINFANRPTADELLDGYTNVRWGARILADILRQSGGDLTATLAAYNGGWHYVNIETTRNYAAKVLDYYGRAVAVRNGYEHRGISRWTVSVALTHGNIPSGNRYVGEDPQSDPSQRIGEHVVYQGRNQRGQYFNIVGYAIPLAE